MPSVFVASAAHVHDAHHVGCAKIHQLRCAGTLGLEVDDAGARLAPRWQRAVERLDIGPLFPRGGAGELLSQSALNGIAFGSVIAP